MLSHAVEDISGDSLIAAFVNGFIVYRKGLYSYGMIFIIFIIIKEPSILEKVVYLLERLPSRAHHLIASRTPPLRSLSRIRTENALSRLDASDLRFGGNRFMPNDTATRAEATVMLLRIFELNR